MNGEKPVARLLVFVPPHRAAARPAESTVVGYVALDRAGRIRQGEAPIASLPRTSRLELVFDAADVLQATVAAPRLAEAKLRQALPALLEEKLLADAADCHFAYQSSVASTAAGEPSLPAAAIDRGLLTRWLDAFAARGERAHAAYSGIYVLPPPSGEALSVRIARGRGVARTALHEGIAFDFDGASVPPQLAIALRQRRWQRIDTWGDGADALAALADDLGVTVRTSGGAVDPDATEGAINLLQGTFARGGLLGELSVPRLLRAARAPLIWAAVAAVVFVGGMNAYWLKLEAEAKSLREAMAASFRSAFADAEMVDPLLQTQRELVRLRARAGQSSAGDFTALNAQVAQLLATAPVGIVAAIEYRDAALRLRFKSPPDGELQNRLRALAVQQGLTLAFEADGAARVAAAGG